MKDSLEIEPVEFEQMMFNVHELGPEVDIVKRFERLSITPEFGLKLPSNIHGPTVVRYIVYMYDKNSPFRKRVPEITRRKQHCAIAAGFPTDDEGNIRPHYRETIINKPLPQVIQMIVEYVRMNREHKFAHLVALEEIYYQKLAKVYSEEKDIKPLEFKQLQDQLEEVNDDLFAGEIDKVVKATVNEVLTYKRIGLRPEDIASLLQANGKFSANQYKISA